MRRESILYNIMTLFIYIGTMSVLIRSGFKKLESGLFGAIGFDLRKINNFLISS